MTVNTDDSARIAVLRMLEEGVGSVAVCEGGKLVGIFTERDVLAHAGQGTDLDAVRIGDVMTRDPLTVDAAVSVLDAARLMGERKIRHLPVVEGDLPTRDGRDPTTSSAASSSGSGSRGTPPRTTPPARSSRARRLGREPLSPPDAVAELVAHAVVQPVVSVLPELVGVGLEAEATPVRRQRHLVTRKRASTSAYRRSSSSRLVSGRALRRGPRGEAALERPRAGSTPPTPRSGCGRPALRRAPGGRAAASGRAAPREGSQRAPCPCGSRSA